MSDFLKYPKVDLHAHYIPQAYLNAQNECFGGNPDRFPQPTWNEEKHLAFMEMMNIKYSVVAISSPHINFKDAEYNQQLCRLCNEEGDAFVRKYPDQIGLMASLPLPDVAASLAEIEYCCDKLNIVGFTMPTNTRGTYMGEPSLEPVFAELDKRGALLTFHPNKPGAVPPGVAASLPIPMMEFFFDTTRTIVDLILKGYITKYSNIRFLLPHCGALLGYIADRLQSYKPVLIKTGTVQPDFDIADIFRRFYLDTAGSSGAKQIPDMRQLVPDDHFFYASDFPFTPDPVIIEQGTGIYQAPYMNETLMQQIFYGNAEKFFGKKFV